jgi:GxxExxY protein
MPITTAVPLRHYCQEEFAKIAYEVVHHAFEVHDSLGRIFHESIYRSSMNRILGKRAIHELPIYLTHQEFRKELYMDLVVDLGCPFELKATSNLTDTHQSQLIQYLMLTGLSHGKLINFGAERVEHRFINCHETLDQRRQFQVEYFEWHSSKPTDRLEQTVVSLVRDWGTGLSRLLYHEAILALMGAAEQGQQFTDTYWRGEKTGRQPIDLIERGVAIKITCKKNDLDHYESHLQRLLANTDLQCILWVNIVSGTVRLQRIGRKE